VAKFYFDQPKNLKDLALKKIKKTSAVKIKSAENH